MAIPKTFIFIGRSGSGKGTQADLLMKYLQKTDPNRPILYIETGQRFRDFLANTHNFTSKMSGIIWDRHDRQPDFIAAWMWSHILIEKFTCAENLVFDGTPRSLAEARILDTAISFYERTNVNIIYINVSREWSRKRLEERQRDDDRSPEAIDRRLNWFDADVMPAVDYYRSHPDHNFIEISGENGINDVHQELVEKIK